MSYNEAPEEHEGQDDRAARCVRVEGDVSRHCFVREFHRYWVLKMVDLMAALTPEEMDTLIRLSDKVDECRVRAGKQPFMCVVVEADWPEYEPTWKAIEARMTANAGNHGPA